MTTEHLLRAKPWDIVHAHCFLASDTHVGRASLCTWLYRCGLGFQEPCPHVAAGQGQSPPSGLESVFFPNLPVTRQCWLGPSDSEKPSGGPLPSMPLLEAWAFQL